VRSSFVVLLVVACAVSASAQRGFGGFTFVRIRYGPDYGYASQRLPWSHDYPVACFCEPGAWVMSDEEAAGLRSYLHTKRTSSASTTSFTG
jgi:hypothetical protein